VNLVKHIRLVLRFRMGEVARLLPPLCLRCLQRDNLIFLTVLVPLKSETERQVRGLDSLVQWSQV
jgi:hypothetical protein